MKGDLIATASIGTDESLRKTDFFRIIEIRIIGSFITIDNREKSRDCPSSSNNPAVSENRRSDNRDLTVYPVFQHNELRFAVKWFRSGLPSDIVMASVSFNN